MEAAKPVVIVNPRSGGGLSERRWATLVGPLTDGMGPFDSRFTEGIGDGRRLAFEEAVAGRSLVVALGGDGTISEVADGLMAAGGVAELGIIPRGTGGDFRRTLDLPSELAAAARHLRDSAPQLIDVGRATFTNREGATVSRTFVNIGSFGFSADAATRANASSKKMGAKLAFLGAAVKSLIGYDNVEVIMRVDDGEPQRKTVLLGAVSNGCFFGGGMKISPHSTLDDGFFDLVVVGDMGRFEVLRKIGKIYEGTHLALNEVGSVRARKIEVHPVPGSGPIPVELDGETPGFLPAIFEIVPRVLRLRF